LDSITVMPVTPNLTASTPECPVNIAHSRNMAANLVGFASTHSPAFEAAPEAESGSK
jgi:hypothetical protein